MFLWQAMPQKIHGIFRTCAVICHKWALLMISWRHSLGPRTPAVLTPAVYDHKLMIPKFMEDKLAGLDIGFYIIIYNIEINWLVLPPELTLQLCQKFWDHPRQKLHPETISGPWPTIGWRFQRLGGGHDILTRTDQEGSQLEEFSRKPVLVGRSIVNRLSRYYVLKKNVRNMCET